MTVRLVAIISTDGPRELIEEVHIHIYLGFARPISFKINLIPKEIIWAETDAMLYRCGWCKFLRYNAGGVILIGQDCVFYFYLHICTMLVGLF